MKGSEDDLNIFDMLNSLSKSECTEADSIADSIPLFILSIPNAAQYKAIELYNLWIQKVGIIPTTDNLARWALEYISYVAKEIPAELLKLQVKNNNV